MPYDIDRLELKEREQLYRDIAKDSAETGTGMARLFFEQGFFLNSMAQWDEVIDPDEDAHYSAQYVVDVFNESSASLDIIGKFAKGVSTQIQFPLSSTYMAALGVISAAMNERFYVQYNGGYHNSIGLYVIAAQPPSTGKSGVLHYLTKPLHEIYAEKREAKDPIRNDLQRKIKRLERAMGKVKDDHELADMDLQLIELQKKLSEVPLYNWCINDPTAEGCEKILSQQGGFFNVISDESAAVKVMLGMVYSDRSTNNGIFLKAWDNGFHSVARQSREGYSGTVRGSFVVLAQESSINAILKAGAEGEGVSERVLMIAERNLLGQRDHSQFNPIDTAILEDYANFCRWLIGNPKETPMPVIFRLEEGAARYIRDMKNGKERLMADGQMYSNPLLRGAMGKMDKQVIKIAAILHAAKIYSHAGGVYCNFSEHLEIGAIEVQRAEAIVETLMGTLLKITHDRGLTGIIAELDVCRKALSRAVNKNGVTSLSLMAFRDMVRQSPSFAEDRSRLTQKLKEQLLPTLQNENLIVWDERSKWIYINPRIKLKQGR